jgi:RimJ/RimL family protein N-acetyltransferase
MMNSMANLPCTYGRLLIREFAPDDRPSLLPFAEDPTLLHFMLFSLGNEKEINGFLEMAQTEAKKENRMEWHLALEDKVTGCFLGSVALMKEKEAPCSAELGYWFKREAWGKGYATEGSRFMLHLGFRVLGLHRIWGKCHVKNPASARVMEKLGMKFEGCIREHVWMRDHYRSSKIFSMLENEYDRGGRDGQDIEEG